MGGGGLLTPSECFVNEIAPRRQGEHFFREYMVGRPNDSFFLIILFDGSRGAPRSKTHDAEGRSAEFFIDLGTLRYVLGMFMRYDGFSYFCIPSPLWTLLPFFESRRI